MNAIMLAALIAPLPCGRLPDEAAIRLTNAATAFAAGIDARGDAVQARKLFKDAAVGFEACEQQLTDAQRQALDRASRGEDGTGSAAP